MLDIYSLKICQQKMITQNSQYIEKKSKKGINHAKITCGWQIKLSKHVQKSLKVGFFTVGFFTTVYEKPICWRQICYCYILKISDTDRNLKMIRENMIVFPH